ncbi:MAG: ImmA/IrrE family metallo-endopeptidase [Prosthecobacter sp.]|jgi:hypothetical protein|uniref:ImmA/IrrE family metallo-endopeptidase n=1 Tax=Prosthecobacter sp. TaxID=1965333 RepID=UPI0019FBEE80|nr:ImmA/IrrE family metallo-endopeptidase [Prosthecobacter sp.]MBE2287482.1 ImmA/IrrE family metallo-endopeptidase [Prosthecobacter sp.]
MRSALGIDFNLRLGRGFKTDVDKLVALVRSSMNFRPHQRMPAAQLAKKLKMSIRTPHDITDIPEEHLQELIVHGKNRWSAVLLKAEQPHNHLIINNPTHSEQRKESNVFHEISHELCEHDPDDVEIIGGLPVRRYCPEKELQAETLGFTLHLPKDCLFWAAKNQMNRTDISDYFCASSELVRFRINATGIERILKKRIP